MPAVIGPDAESLRRAAHKALNTVGKDIEGLRFNRAIATIYDFANTLAAAIQKPASPATSDEAWVLREACEIMVLIVNPMMPHLAEECWSRLGYNTLLANEPWRKADPGLLIDDTVTIAVQVNGKRRDEIVVPRDAGRDEIEAAALQLDSVVRAVEGRAIKKVIVVPQRIVNVVA